MDTPESRPNKFLIWGYLVGVAIASYMILKVIMWMDGAR